MTHPTPEQEQRAKWDLLLTDLELRQEQIQQCRRLEPLDIEKLRQLRTYEGWRLAFAGLAAGATLLAAGAALGGLAVALLLAR